MSRYASAHASPNGPGDARPTALQIVEDEGLIGKLADKVFLVTGISSGIGIETLRALYATGAHVIGTVRNLEKGKAVVDDIKRETKSEGKISLVLLDNASLESVRKGAEEIKKLTDRLDVAVFNAGVTATPQSKTVDGFETQFATNHLSHFLLFNLLKDLLQNNNTTTTTTTNKTDPSPARVVSVSSLAHRIAPTRLHDLNFTEPDSYQPWTAYGQAKTANIHLANAITRRYGSQSSSQSSPQNQDNNTNDPTTTTTTTRPRPINALSLHPGGIMTGLQVHLPASQVQSWNDSPEMARYLKSAQQGAATSVHAALGRELEGVGAAYLSDCAVQGPFGLQDPMAIGDEGFERWAFDGAAEEALWERSAEMVGLGRGV